MLLSPDALPPGRAELNDVDASVGQPLAAAVAEGVRDGVLAEGWMLAVLVEAGTVVAGAVLGRGAPPLVPFRVMFELPLL